MARYNTRDGDAIGAAISRREAFKTHGALWGEPRQHPLTGWDTGRLPEEYVEMIRGRESVSYVIYSYATPIAWYDNETGSWTHPGVKYSPTTTQHQHTARYATR